MIDTVPAEDLAVPGPRLAVAVAGLGDLGLSGRLLVAPAAPFHLAVQLVVPTADIEAMIERHGGRALGKPIADATEHLLAETLETDARITLCLQKMRQVQLPPGSPGLLGNMLETLWVWRRGAETRVLMFAGLSLWNAPTQPTAHHRLRILRRPEIIHYDASATGTRHALLPRA